MRRLSHRNKTVLAEKIGFYKQKCFPGKGSGVRLAEEIGVTPQTISNWLNGNRAPTLIQMYRLAKAFDVSPLTLCGMKKNTAPHYKEAHIPVLVNLLEYWGENANTEAKSRITRKTMLSIKHLIQNELFD